MNVFEGNLVSGDVKVGIVCSRFNELVVNKLLGGALDGLKRHEVKQENIDISPFHEDCGLMIFDITRQKDTGAGGSGCGCSGAVVCSDILSRIENGELKRVFFVGTGALMSGVSSLQSESIPGVAHGVLLTGG